MTDSVSIGEQVPWPGGEDYMLNLGLLVAHYHSLEFILRVYLQAQPTARPVGLQPGDSPYEYQVGEMLPENELTSFDSLGELVQKVNLSLSESDVEVIDPEIVKVRDALAHGRVSAPSLSKDIHLVKFGRPQNGQVRMEFNEIVSVEWLNQKRINVVSVIKRVAALLPTHNNQINQGQG
ncbi:MAG: hypothetical protein Salg2KO_21800 [Salibacteraceae bacterium]